jgi:hypothetical protein
MSSLLSEGPLRPRPVPADPAIPPIGTVKQDGSPGSCDATADWPVPPPPPLLPAPLADRPSNCKEPALLCSGARDGGSTADAGVSEGTPRWSPPGLARGNATAAPPPGPARAFSCCTALRNWMFSRLSHLHGRGVESRGHGEVVMMCVCVRVSVHTCVCACVCRGVVLFPGGGATSSGLCGGSYLRDV